MFNLGLPILCGFLGGLALHRLKVPGGMMLGSVIAVAFLNIQTTHVFMPGRSGLSPRSSREPISG